MKACARAYGLLMLGAASLASCTSTSKTAQLTLSGTVDGLDGTVVIAVGAEQLSVPQAGAFTFATVFSSGQIYNVTVQQQPASQQCTVYNGSGSFGDADITNVQIACEDSAPSGGGKNYTVGGIAVELAGPLSLKNTASTGTEVLEVPQSGVFTFSRGLTQGTQYDVTIITQPADQTCAVVNGQGIVATANVTTVQVLCRFTVGGTVSGLSGSVQLLNEAGDGTSSSLTLTQTGDFQFPNNYANAITYNVSITAQPTDQACLVENGTGTVQAQDVSNVYIVCAPTTFPVGGTLSGLESSSVTLQLADGQSVSVSANGNFTVGQVMGGTPYAVFVTSQPTGQLCTVADGNGTVPLDAGVSTVQVICGPNSPNDYTVSGSVQGLQSSTQVSLANGSDTLLTGNGAFTMQQTLRSGMDYNVLIAAQPQAQLCAVAQGSGIVNDANVTDVQVTCVRHISFLTAQNANTEIGQPDFNSSSPAATSAASLNAPTGPVFVDASGQAYLSDSLDNRVVGYAQLAAGEALFVLGQPDPTTTTAVGNANLSLPASITSNGAGMAISDANNNRVLLYDTTWTAQSSPTPAVVVGQSSLATNANDCTATGLNQPSHALIAGGRLIIADTGNHRILIWNSVPTTSGTAANIVLGQSNFTTCTPNQGNYGASGATLWSPTSTWTNGTALYGVDTNNNRILIWNNLANLSTGATASLVLGQPNMTTNIAACSPAALAHPTFMDSDGTQLFVTDQLNSRLVIYPHAPTNNGAAASSALGAESLTACNCNHGAANVLCQPSGVSVIGTAVTVTDTGNNRLLVFESL